MYQNVKSPTLWISWSKVAVPYLYLREMRMNNAWTLWVSEFFGGLTLRRFSCCFSPELLFLSNEWQILILGCDLNFNHSGISVRGKISILSGCVLLWSVVVLYYIVYGSYARNSLYSNVRCIRVIMCVNAMWMCHHWFMHIETHPCLGRSHTRASTIVIMVNIRNTFDVHMT